MTARHDTPTAHGPGATRRFVRGLGSGALLLVLASCACGSDTNPLSLMVGTWVHEGTFSPSKGVELDTTAEVTCEPIGQGYGLVCYGYPGESFGFMDVYDWDPKARRATQRSLGTVPGERVTTMTGSWNAETSELKFSGKRQEPDGKTARVRSTHVFSKDGPTAFRYYVREGGVERLVLDITIRPK